MSNYEELEQKQAVSLLNNNNDIVLVSQKSLKDNYTLDLRLKSSVLTESILRNITPLSPIMTYYTGVKYLMIGVAKIKGNHALAIYQSMECGSIYTKPIDQFYDQFAIANEVGFASTPIQISEFGSLGYIANENAANASKQPLLFINYSKDKGTLEAQVVSDV